MDYEAAISQLQSEFEENPLDFFVEAELQARLQEILKEQVSGKTKVTETENEPGTQKHRDYTDAALETDYINRVHLEVKTEQEGGNIDLCIFGEEASVSMSSGTKNFDAEDLEAAVELKFVKNLDYAQDKKVEDIREDIQRLDRLPNHLYKAVVIFANKDIFREGTKYSDRLEDLKQESEHVEVFYSHVPA